MQESSDILLCQEWKYQDLIFSVVFVTGRWQRKSFFFSSAVVTAQRKVTDCFWQVANRVQSRVSAKGKCLCSLRAFAGGHTSITDGTGRARQVAQREKPTAAKWNCSHEKERKKKIK